MAVSLKVEERATRPRSIRNKLFDIAFGTHRCKQTIF